MIKRINALIKDARRNPFVGIGNPEPLKNDLSGVWSRRINETDRLTYCLEDDILLNYPMDKARGFLTDHENLLFKLRPPAWEMVAPALKYCVD